MELLMHSQTSTPPLKFGNLVINFISYIEMDVISYLYWVKSYPGLWKGSMIFVSQQFPNLFHQVLACGFSRYGSTGHGDENYYVHRPTLVTSLESKVQQVS